ncbi:hypothetical protein HDF14_005225 [Edaphobacter lichenicola]|jgi:hypothetical protein|uniref:Uncharacterized protein n=1 Tax=Tunturiibacter gelidiferens TaxID=3069689 RepID=A0A9X0QJD9_9BACT|nr:hypothetical protein [Edaphobacter lichenicola]
MPMHTLVFPRLSRPLWIRYDLITNSLRSARYALNISVQWPGRFLNWPLRL